MIVWVDSGVDLFAFEKLMATFSDWLVTCHPTVPAVCKTLAIAPQQDERPYPQSWREHASRNNQVGQHEA